MEVIAELKRVPLFGPPGISELEHPSSCNNSVTLTCTVLTNIPPFRRLQGR